MLISDLNDKELGSYLENYINDFTHVLTSEKAGEGNMNITLRVKNQQGRSVIIKQSPPYCAKYPSIKAPEKRAISEAIFYELVNKNQNLKNYFPDIIFKDEINNILGMEDLGAGSDFLELYNKKEIEDQDLIYLTKALALINNQEYESKVLENKEMRKLNYEYIFLQPLENIQASNLESVNEGLTDLGRKLSENTSYKNKAKELGNIYLSSGRHLCHGDFYPGSWIKTQNKIWIIDPEFGYVGRPEFDYGVMLAHLYLASQPEDKIELFMKNYLSPNSFDQKTAISFGGVEIMRRLLGVAQLPITMSLKEKEYLLDQSFKMVVKGAL